MQLAMVGLGRMGFNMTQRLIEHGHNVVVYDLNTAAVGRAGEKGATPAASLAELASKLPVPRVVWIMVPSGDPTEQTINAIAEHLQPGDMIIDGGNSNYKDSMRRGAALKAKGIHFLDCGTSGGVWGLANGYCLMVGGDQDAYNHAEPIFKALAPENGCARVGPLGAGHFTKMVHNGIEYGMLQAYAEGFEIMHASKFGLDMGQLAALWGQGSVVRSWMLELAERAFRSNGSDLNEIKGWVADSGEGRWTVQEAIDLDVPAPVITLSLLQRFVSRQDESYGAKVIATIRNEFGGHAVKKQEG
jgi:6-phosphogluconate dehydrogenase